MFWFFSMLVLFKTAPPSPQNSLTAFSTAASHFESVFWIQIALIVVHNTTT
jgi:hypothetical protein